MTAVLNGPLEQFAEARAGARRFHADIIGKGVDPAHCWADYLWKLWQGDRRGLEKEYGAHLVERNHHPVQKTALSESAGGATGGYLVPADLRYDLMRDVAEAAIFRSRALVVPMKTATLDLSLPNATTAPTTAGTAFAFGSMLLSFKTEAAARPETEPLFNKVQLKAWELTGYALMSNNLAADGGGALEKVLRKLFANAIAWYEDYWFLNGNGVGQPMGILNTPAASVVARQTTSQFTNQDTGNMSAALLPSSWPTAIWIMAPTVFKYVTQLTGWQANQPMPDVDGKGPRPRFVLSGQEGFSTEKLPALGTQGDVTLVDPARYVIGDRETIDIAVSKDEPTAFKNNQSVFRIVHRFDGQPWFGSQITLTDTTTVASPYVILKH